MTTAYDPTEHHFPRVVPRSVNPAALAVGGVLALCALVGAGIAYVADRLLGRLIEGRAE